MRLTVFSLYLQLAEGMLKDMDVNVVKVALLIRGLDNSAILITDQRYDVQGTNINLGHKTTYYGIIGI